MYNSNYLPFDELPVRCAVDPFWSFLASGVLRCFVKLWCKADQWMSNNCSVDKPRYVLNICKAIMNEFAIHAAFSMRLTQPPYFQTRTTAPRWHGLPRKLLHRSTRTNSPYIPPQQTKNNRFIASNCTKTSFGNHILVWVSKNFWGMGFLLVGYRPADCKKERWSAKQW